tara:strand:+ start:53 stop:691 length:639 start_codon:yes stop_codon:yes gene_type:complete
MSIKQNGGVFGRNPTFNDVTIEGQLTFDGDIDINSDLKVDGDIETTGNVIIATSGKGIDFSATAGTGTSELFDDYEEGTWTPVYAPQTGSFATMTMEVYDAVYTKIGNTVFISAFMRTDNVDMGTASGTLRITGLPFAPSSVVSTGGVEVSFAGAFGGDYPLSGWFESSYIQLSYRTSVNGTSLSSIVTDLTAGATANQNTLRISGMYKTAS